MTVFQRQQKILEFLNEKHFSTVKELAGHVWSSESSVRRDIKALEAKGYISQIYGGVVLAEYENSVAPVVLRDSSNSAVKEELAKMATEHIFDGATIIMDGSSTVRRIIKHIAPFRNLKIISNNLRVFSECENPDTRVYCTGGLFLKQSNIFVGSGAEKYISGINADILFFSSQAISEDGVISDSSEEETALRRIMMSRAKKKIYLCDSSKLCTQKTFVICTKDDVDHIICNKKLPWE